MFRIGKITNTHGIKGEVKVYNTSDFDRFSVGREVYVLVKESKRFFHSQRVRTSKNLLIVKFEGIDDINDIEHLKGYDLWSDERIDEALGQNDYHYDMLIDKPVYNREGQKLGVVLSMIPVPQGHLMEIIKTDGKKALIPFVGAFVKAIDDEKITIEPIEGLL